MSLITDIPTGVASALGTTGDVAGLVLSAFILFGVGITVALLKKGKSNDQLMLTLVMLASMGGLTAIGWCPVWLLIVAVLVVASLFGAKMAQAVSR